MEIKTEIIINTTTEKVWKALLDFDNYPNWNPFIKAISGKPEIGNTIKVVLPGMTFKPKVVAFETDKEFRWLGHLLFKGLFDGEHIFNIKENPDGTTTFYHSEKFSGILVPLFRKKLLSETKQGFETMNIKLKEVVEQF